jgi:hypothetical protein
MTRAARAHHHWAFQNVFRTSSKWTLSGAGSTGSQEVCSNAASMNCSKISKGTLMFNDPAFTESWLSQLARHALTSTPTERIDRV